MPRFHMQPLLFSSVIPAARLAFCLENVEWLLLNSETSGRYGRMVALLQVVVLHKAVIVKCHLAHEMTWKLSCVPGEC